MTKLFSFLVVFFILNSFALADETLHLQKLQELTILMRIPEEVCKEAAELSPYFSSEGRLAYDETLAALKEDLKLPATAKKFMNKAKSCKVDCTCGIFDDLGDLFSKSQNKLAKTVKAQASKVTDKDFIRCHKKLKLSCSSKNIQQALENAKKAKAEQNP